MQPIKEKEDRWLEFWHVEDKPKTKVYSVISKCSKDCLGKIRWHPAWRHYCYFPTIDFEAVYSDRCMITIGKFLEELNWRHKNAHNY